MVANQAVSGLVDAGWQTGLLLLAAGSRERVELASSRSDAREREGLEPETLRNVSLFLL